MGKHNFLTAEWRNLIMANYIVEPSILKKYIPKGTELDLWNGRCYISLVGFMFLNTKVLGVSIPFHRHFEEINLRFYVRHWDGTEWKRGVVFLKEIVPKSAITFVANHLYYEHYITLPMRHEWRNSEKENYCSYAAKIKNEWSTFAVETKPTASILEPQSEAAFITEHYWGYTKVSEEKTSEYEVAHPSWNIYEVKKSTIDFDGDAIYGAPFGKILKEKPASVFMADGSEIMVKGKRNLKSK